MSARTARATSTTTAAAPAAAPAPPAASPASIERAIMRRVDDLLRKQFLGFSYVYGFGGLFYVLYCLYVRWTESTSVLRFAIYTYFHYYESLANTAAVCQPLAQFVRYRAGGGRRSRLWAVGRTFDEDVAHYDREAYCSDGYSFVVISWIYSANAIGGYTLTVTRRLGWMANFACTFSDGLCRKLNDEVWVLRTARYFGTTPERVLSFCAAFGIEPTGEPVHRRGTTELLLDLIVVGSNVALFAAALLSGVLSAYMTAALLSAAALDQTTSE